MRAVLHCGDEKLKRLLLISKKEWGILYYWRNYWWATDLFSVLYKYVLFTLMIQPWFDREVSQFQSASHSTSEEYLIIVVSLTSIVVHLVVNGTVAVYIKLFQNWHPKSMVESGTTESTAIRREWTIAFTMRQTRRKYPKELFKTP